jgi:Acetyltransferases, including N-acetylases of ribosomal proteins
MVIRNHPDAIKWIEDRIGAEGQPGPVVSFARVAPDTSIRAALMFFDYRGHDISVAMASAMPGRFGRELLVHGGQFAFGELDCDRISIETSHPAAVRFAQALGGELEGRKRNAQGPGRDTYLFGILREDWPLPLEG